MEKPYEQPSLMTLNQSLDMYEFRNRPMIQRFLLGLKRPPTIIRALVELAISIAVSASALYYFIIYAFANPDSHYCFAAENTYRASPESMNRGSNVENSTEEDVAAKFTQWFMAGAFIWLCFAAMRLGHFIGAMQKSVCTVYVMHAISGLLFLASFFWTLNGTLIRYSHNG